MLCPNCSGVAEKQYRVGDLNQSMSKELFDYYKCNSCKLIFEFPVPGDLESYYGSEYCAYQQTTIDEIRNASKSDLEKLYVVQRFSKGNKLLEVGSGSGAFAYLAKQAGFIVDAIEMDASCCEILEKTIGVNKAINSCEITAAISQLNVKYDAIVMWQVLEHLRNPWEVLGAVSSSLAKGGVLALAMPNPESLHFAILKQYWMHLDAPRHVTLIPPKTLVNVASKLGLKKITVTTKGELNSQHSSIENWRRSLDNFHRGAPSSFFKRLLISVGWRTATFKLLSWFERIEGKGSSYLAVFEKK